MEGKVIPVHGLVIEIIEPMVELLTPEEEIIDFPRRLEVAGRTAYKSEKKISKGSSNKFIVDKIIKHGHESVLEHCSITVKYIGDRSMSHQLVRHRIAAYTQESQRYCNYGKNDSLKVIVPPSVSGMRNLIGKMCVIGLKNNNGSLAYIKDKDGSEEYIDDKNDPLWMWILSCVTSYKTYVDMLRVGIPPEDARSVLPNATKTEIVTTFNLREWRHFFDMRCDKHAQWQIRGLAMKTLDLFYQLCPIVFADKWNKFNGK